MEASHVELQSRGPGQQMADRGVQQTLVRTLRALQVIPPSPTQGGTPLCNAQALAARPQRRGAQSHAC